MPDGMASADFGVAGAMWSSEAGLVLLPWDVVRGAEDPHAEVVRFGDAVYGLAGWPAELSGPRVDGRHAAEHSVFGVAAGSYSPPHRRPG